MLLQRLLLSTLRERSEENRSRRPLAGFERFRTRSTRPASGDDRPAVLPVIWVHRRGTDGIICPNKYIYEEPSVTKEYIYKASSVSNECVGSSSYYNSSVSSGSQIAVMDETLSLGVCRQRDIPIGGQIAVGLAG